ncbi:MAG: VPLPA-CTERM sorting domain-containing protein [Pseudomonadota bacterium]
MIKSLITAAFVAAAPFAACATVINVTGTDIGDSFAGFPTPTGVHGLELRAGKSGTRGDWELGLGPATSTNGGFAQAQNAWGNHTNPTLFDFELIYGGYGSVDPGNAAFWIWDAGGPKPSLPSLSWTTGGLMTGNALAIASKGLAMVEIEKINGVAVDITAETSAVGQFEELVLYAPGFADGFSIAGSLRINPKYDKASGGNSGWKDAGSRNEVFLKPGYVTAPAPVPLPAALPLMLAGIAGFIALRARNSQ